MYPTRRVVGFPTFCSPTGGTARQSAGRGTTGASFMSTPFVRINRESNYFSDLNGSSTIFPPRLRCYVILDGKNDSHRV